MLTVMRGGNARPSKLAEGSFDGTVWTDVYLSPAEGGVSYGNLFFEPCSRTHWHSHPGGQVLVIVAGEGFVATEDEKVTVRAGDVVWTPPNVRHWHGATPDRFLVHTAISLGITEWAEPVSDERYRQPAQ